MKNMNDYYHSLQKRDGNVSACPHVCSFVAVACHRKSGTAEARTTVQSVQIGL